MKPNLNDIIEQLDTDPLFAVRITDIDKGLPLCTNKFGAQMKSENGSVEGYFNALYDKGVKNVVIQLRRKNGSSFVDKGEAFRYSFMSEEPAHQAEPIAPTQGAAYDAPGLIPGLMGSNHIGLNALQQAHRLLDYDRVVKERDEYKAENKELNAKVKKLKKKQIKNEFSESKAQGNKDLISTLMSQAPGILTGIAAMKGGGAVAADPGLASPTANLGTYQQALIEAIQHNKDYVAEYLLIALNGMRDNPEFGNEFLELLTKHNLQSA